MTTVRLACPAVDQTGWTALAEALAADVRRVSERLRHLSQAQLAAPAAPVSPTGAGQGYDSRAQAGRVVAQVLADTALVLEAAAAGTAPDLRRLPELGDFAVGDQVAVTGHDVLAAMEQVRPDTQVAADTGERATPGPTAADVVAGATRLLADVRRRL